MRFIFLLAVVGMCIGATGSPRAQDRADAEAGVRYEKPERLVSVWAQRRAAAKAAIRAQIDLFGSAFNEGDAKALAALYTKDAFLLPPGQAQIGGRDEIAQFWEAVIGAGVEDLVLVPVEIVVVRDTAYEIRTLMLSVPTEGGKHRPVKAKSIVVWQEDWDGIWRLHRDIWTFVPPMPRLLS